MTPRPISPLAALVANSLDPSEVGAPVARELLILSIGSGFGLFACAVFGRFAVHPGTGSWMFVGGMVRWCTTWSARIATPGGTLALACLALDVILATGVPVGLWARGACIAQIALAAIGAVPELILLVLVVLTIVIYVALVVLGACLVIALLVGLAAGG